jgi:hypothetical protein
MNKRKMDQAKYKLTNPYRTYTPWQSAPRLSSAWTTGLHRHRFKSPEKRSFVARWRAHRRTNQLPPIGNHWIGLGADWSADARAIYCTGGSLIKSTWRAVVANKKVSADHYSSTDSLVNTNMTQATHSLKKCLPSQFNQGLPQPPRSETKLRPLDVPFAKR